MTKYTPNEIVNALAIIKDTCTDAHDCYFCPFYDDSKNRCFVSPDGVLPTDWKLNTIDEAWRAIL